MRLCVLTFIKWFKFEQSETNGPWCITKLYEICWQAINMPNNISTSLFLIFKIIWIDLNWNYQDASRLFSSNQLSGYPYASIFFNLST